MLEDPFPPSTDIDRLSRLFAVEDSSDGLWRDSESAAVFRHQLQASLPGDLAPLDRHGVVAESRCATFGELLRCPDPPAELLELVKAFSKRSGSGDNSLPKDVARLLYVLTISVALVRLGERLSGLTDDALRSRIAWAAGIPWLDSDLRELLQAASSGLN